MVQTRLSEKVFNATIEDFFRWFEFSTEVLPIVPRTDTEITVQVIFQVPCIPIPTALTTREIAGLR